jgi:hypothetical protein
LHLYVKNCAQPCIPLSLCEIPGHHLGKNISRTQFFGQYQKQRFMFTSSAVILIVNLRAVLLPVLFCHLSVLLMVVRCAAHLQQGFSLQKHFVPGKAYVLDIASSLKA